MRQKEAACNPRPSQVAEWFHLSGMILLLGRNSCCMKDARVKWLSDLSCEFSGKKVSNFFRERNVFCWRQTVWVGFFLFLFLKGNINLGQSWLLTHFRNERSCELRRKTKADRVEILWWIFFIFSLIVNKSSRRRHSFATENWFFFCQDIYYKRLNKLIVRLTRSFIVTTLLAPRMFF